MPALARTAGSDGADADDVAARAPSPSKRSPPDRTAPSTGKNAEALAQGCTALGALAQNHDPQRAAAARRTLDMLADYGCRAHASDAG